MFMDMKHFYRWAFALLAWPLAAQTNLTGNPAELPFILELEEVTQDELPGLHSGAFAQWDGEWVVIGGRVGGLHGFFPFTAFPESEANANIWLMDPENGDLHNHPVGNLSLPYLDQLTATNPQYAQDGEWLYIAGGYGKESGSGNLITFPVLTAVHLPTLAQTLRTGTNPKAAFRQLRDERFRVCGGEMDKMGDFFYLVGGHDFSGNYTQTASPSFSQRYANTIRKFKLAPTNNGIAVSEYSAHEDAANLHRRDFTLAPLIQPNGQEALCLYGGVFRPDADLPYYNPVYIGSNNIKQVDTRYEQLFSQYTCPAVPLFDSLDGSMYTMFFAGLSAYYQDRNTGEVKYDERVPFIKDITTFRRKADGSSKEFIMPIKFDELLGTNMIFAPSKESAHYANEVFRFRAFQGRTCVGHLFGGIKADIPNITTSRASKRMFKVWITPKSTGVTGEAAASKPILKIYPNPISTNQTPQIDIQTPYFAFNLVDMQGRSYCHGKSRLENSVSQTLLDAPPGIYYLTVQGEHQAQTVKIVKIQ